MIIILITPHSKCLIAHVLHLIVVNRRLDFIYCMTVGGKQGNEANAIERATVLRICTAPTSPCPESHTLALTWVQTTVFSVHCKVHKECLGFVDTKVVFQCSTLTLYNIKIQLLQACTCFSQFWACKHSSTSLIASALH